MNRIEQEEKHKQVAEIASSIQEYIASLSVTSQEEKSKVIAYKKQLDEQMDQIQYERGIEHEKKRVSDIETKVREEAYLEMVEDEKLRLINGGKF